MLNINKRVKFNTTLDEELYNQLKAISDKYSIPMSKLLDSAIELLVDYIDKNKKSNNTSE